MRRRHATRHGCCTTLPGLHGRWLGVRSLRVCSRCCAHLSHEQIVRLIVVATCAHLGGRTCLRNLCETGLLCQVSCEIVLGWHAHRKVLMSVGPQRIATSPGPLGLHGHVSRSTWVARSRYNSHAENKNELYPHKVHFLSYWISNRWRNSPCMNHWISNSWR